MQAFWSVYEIQYRKKKKKLWIRKAVYSVWMDTDQISVQIWQEKEGKEDVSWTITDITVQLSRVHLYIG